MQFLFNVHLILFWKVCSFYIYFWQNRFLSLKSSNIQLMNSEKLNSVWLHNEIALKTKISKFFKEGQIILVCNFSVSMLLSLDLFIVIGTLDIYLVTLGQNISDLAPVLVHHYLSKFVDLILCCFLYKRENAD